jgi:hypothetical protein
MGAGSDGRTYRNGRCYVWRDGGDTGRAVERYAVVDGNDVDHFAGVGAVVVRTVDNGAGNGAGDGVGVRAVVVVMAGMLWGTTAVLEVATAIPGVMWIIELALAMALAAVLLTVLWSMELATACPSVPCKMKVDSRICRMGQSASVMRIPSQEVALHMKAIIPARRLSSLNARMSQSTWNTTGVSG